MEPTSKICLTCNKELYGKTQKVFCSRSCAVTANNKGVRRHGKNYKCVVCGTPKNNCNTKYCSQKCRGAILIKVVKQKILNGEFVDPSTIRRHLLLSREYKCSCCGLSEWNGKPIPLDVHHIDGNHKNNSIDNLTLLCKNCHAQTDNYGSKNKGRGRYPNKTHPKYNRVTDGSSKG